MLMYYFKDEKNELSGHIVEQNIGMASIFLNVVFSKKNSQTDKVDEDSRAFNISPKAIIRREASPAAARLLLFFKSFGGPVI